MAQDTDRLRDEIEDQRAAISGTVDQIENRVSPGRIMARRQDRIQSRVTRWKDSVFGHEPGSAAHRTAYGPGTGLSGQGHDDGGRLDSARHRAGDTMGAARDSVHDAPEALRQHTAGNPWAAGALALAAGWLVGSLLPRSEREQQLAHDMEPQLSDVASTVRSEGGAIAGDLRQSAHDAVDQVKETGQGAASDVRDQARS